MKRMNRKKILTRFESVRDGLWQAHMAFAEHGDKVAMACIRAHHGNVNHAIEDLGGKAIGLPDLESFLENKEIKSTMSYRRNYNETCRQAERFYYWLQEQQEERDREWEEEPEEDPHYDEEDLTSTGA
jgi:hypothetical protein